MTDAKQTSESTRLERAIVFAAACHAGVKDKGGLPYILHPLRVMAGVSIYDEASQCAAVLHDVVEDCGITLAQIAQAFGHEVADIVDALSRRPGETYFDFIHRCQWNPKGRAIKVLDIHDNMRPDRAKQLPEKERDGNAERYRKALTILCPPI